MIAKRTFLIILAIVAMLPLCAQPGSKPKDNDTSLVEMVSNLSSSQKRKLEALQKESKEKIDRIKQQRDAVRDSIHTVMNLYGDHSKEIFPMFERESALQAEISRELYRVKVRADEILTREQHQELMKKVCSKGKKKAHHK